MLQLLAAPLFVSSNMFLGFLHSFIFSLALGIIVQSKTFNNTIYVISNAETPSLDLPGLTLIGALLVYLARDDH